MNESKIPWPIWATVMLACAVVAAWASRPQTDDQRVEDLQEEIDNLKVQINHPQQPTYSPSVSEPSPSPTSTPTPKPTPSPTNYPTSTPTIEPPNKSRSEYVCKFLGINQGVRLEPSISGSTTREWNCFVPISSGRCVARGQENDPFGHLHKTGPTGLRDCDGDSITIEDPATGEKYYQFNAVYGSVRFVLEK